MPAKTNTEKIDEISKKVGDHIPLTEYRLDELNRRVQKLEELPPQVARMEERTKPLEKGFDRLWQLIPIVVSVIAILVTLLKK